jgi:hypothetical protein
MGIQSYRYTGTGKILRYGFLHTGTSFNMLCLSTQKNIKNKAQNKFLRFVVDNLLSGSEVYAFAFVITAIIHTMHISRKGDNSRTHTHNYLMGFWTNPVNWFRIKLCTYRYSKQVVEQR